MMNGLDLRVRVSPVRAGKMSIPGHRTWLRVGLGVAALSLLAYLPLLRLPLISDDYLQIGLAREYGSWKGQQTLFADALYRCRATSLWLTWLIDRLAGPDALVTGIICFVFHVANSMLVYALGCWSRIGWKVSAAAAGFFAIYEGHQEAVVWFAALPELLVFFFGLLALLSWAAWLDSRSFKWLAASFLLYVMCLLSKESGVVVPPLMALYAWARREPLPRIGLGLAPAALVSLGYTLSIFAAQRSHLHFNDGTFSLSAPFYTTVLVSIARMLWFWGLLALVLGLSSRACEFRALLVPATVWIVVTLLPYAFLTYMPRIPSRHTYFASAGLSLLVGASLVWALPALRAPRWAAAAVFVAVIAHNAGYLWIKKLPQYQRRAEPTEQLLEFARTHPGPIQVNCFPYGEDVVYHALEISGGRSRDQIRVRETPTSVIPNQFCYDQKP
jgi:hypothetical protein